MTAQQVRQAIAEVRELKDHIIERKRFRGYSGIARALGGLLAIVTAAILSSSHYPRSAYLHAPAWGALALAGFLINGTALLRWFLSDPEVGRDARRLIPVFYALPPFLVGCALTLSMLLHENYHYLFGVWMCCYGLTNLSQNQVLPSSIRVVGLFYIICGIVILTIWRVPFINPWPMGIVFFIGELWGGTIFYLNRTGLSLPELFRPGNGER